MKSGRSKRLTSARRRRSPSPLVATQREAAQLLGISESSVGRMLDRWGDDGKLIEKRQLPRLIGLRRILIPRSAIADYLEQQVAQRNEAAS